MVETKPNTLTHPSSKRHTHEKMQASLLTSPTFNLTCIMKRLRGLLLSIYMVNARCQNPVWNPQCAARVHWTRIIPNTEASALNKNLSLTPEPCSLNLHKSRTNGACTVCFLCWCVQSNGTSVMTGLSPLSHNLWIINEVPHDLLWIVKKCYDFSPEYPSFGYSWLLYL